MQQPEYYVCLSALSACGSSSASDSSKGQVYYLNSKPEIVDQVKKLGEEYGKATGVKVNIDSATADNYESTLTSELSKSNAPTMFNVSSYPTFVKVKNYLLPLQGTAEYKLLTKEGKAAAMQQDGKTYSLPFVSEYVTTIYNKKILKNYCSKSYAVIKSTKDIKNFDTLSKVVKDMQKHKDDLGIKAGWATPGLDSSDSYRIGEHAVRIMIDGEYRAKNVKFSPTLTGKYVNNYKDFVDLQLQNNPTPAAQIAGKTVDDVMSEFSLGEVPFVQSGTWTNTQIDTSAINKNDIGVMPYWMGIPGEEKYGVGASHEMQWGINSKSPKQDQKATLAFIKWCVSSKEGKQIMSKDMGFSVPFTTFGANDQPTNNPIMTEALKLNKTKPVIPVPIVPSTQYSKTIADALTEYAQGTGKWSKVNDAIVNGWASEWQTVKQQIGSLPENGLE
ncbi:MAG: ABC transporter substrate-binding protein [Bifidobacterium sp.]|nr:ABC transporter substrate-binding protein [Bifidobacterium sp.]